jgi:Uma2 family endonuclease
MATTSPAKLITADEFFCMPDDGKLYELVEGRLEEVPGASPRSSAVAANIVTFLNIHVRRHKLGKVGGADWGARLFSDPDTVRVPDAVFVRTERLPNGKVPIRFQDGAPDLVVEVLSPSDRYRRTSRKVREYLDAGARIVLVIDPDDRSAVVHRPGGVIEDHAADAAIDLSEAVPGFVLNLPDIWEDGEAGD